MVRVQKNYEKRINLSFDKRKDANVSWKSRRRAHSFISKAVENNFSVVVDETPVTKNIALNLKKIFDCVCNKGSCLGSDLINELRKNTIENVGKINAEKNYNSFRDFIADLYFNADPGQISRILALINSNFYAVMTPLPEKAKKTENDEKTAKFKKMFQKFDLNGDGVVDFNEFKTALEPNFTNDAINELFIAHSRNNSGIDIKGFTDMFLNK